MLHEWWCYVPSSLIVSLRISPGTTRDPYPSLVPVKSLLLNQEFLLVPIGLTSSSTPTFLCPFALLHVRVISLLSLGKSRDTQVVVSTLQSTLPHVSTRSFDLMCLVGIHFPRSDEWTIPPMWSRTFVLLVTSKISSLTDVESWHVTVLPRSTSHLLPDLPGSCLPHLRVLRHRH